MSLYKKWAISLVEQILRSAQDDYYLFSGFTQFFKNLPRAPQFGNSALEVNFRYLASNRDRKKCGRDEDKGKNNVGFNGQLNTR